VNVLHTQSSPRGESSNSIALTNAFIDACQSRYNSLVIDTLNVWNENLPEFDSEAIGAKYKAVKNVSMTKRETAVWHQNTGSHSTLSACRSNRIGNPNVELCASL
jgi:FMN-dependent NADH-azoreductase